MDLRTGQGDWSFAQTAPYTNLVCCREHIRYAKELFNKCSWSLGDHGL